MALGTGESRAFYKVTNPFFFLFAVLFFSFSFSFFFLFNIGSVLESEGCDAKAPCLVGIAQLQHRG